MTSTPPPVWPAVATTPTPAPSSSPRPAPVGRTSTTAMVAAVALAGVLVGFGGSQALSHSNFRLSLPNVASVAPAPAAAPANPAPANPAPAARPANPANPVNPANPANAARPGRQPRTGTAATTPPAAANAGSPANATDQAAIQQAIQAIDDAQVKAVASKDLSGLAAGATSSFATQQKTVTQDLLDNGVTEIKLVNIEWGPITVNGTTATATAYETWSTTFSDSTTEQSRDQNVYTLVQQDGSWQVQTDEHPDATPTGAFPGIPDGLTIPPGFPNPFRQPGTGNPAPQVNVQP